MRHLLVALASIALHAPVLAAQGDPVQRPLPTTTTNVRPAPPGNVVASVAGPGAIIVTWDAVPGATAYDIGFHMPPDGWRRITRVSAGNTRFVHPGRPPLRSHTYQVVTVADHLASVPARSNEVMSAPDAPTGGPTAMPSGGAVTNPPTTTTGSTPTTTTTTTTTPTTSTTSSQPPATPTIAPGDSTVCSTGWTGGRVICTSAEWRFSSSLTGRVAATVSCPRGHFVVTGGWSGDFDRGAVTISRPTQVTGWEAFLTLPNPTVQPAMREYTLRAWVLCTPD